MTAAVDLQFQGPFSLLSREPPSLFDEPAAQKPGIYLWAVPYHLGGYLPIYVGETGASIAQRNKDHVIQTLGGNYRVCDPDRLPFGEARVIWNGLWRKDCRHRLGEYLHRVEELLPAIRRELLLEVVFVAPAKLESRLRRRIEGAVAGHIRSQPPPACSLLPSDIRYHLRRSTETPVAVRISIPVNVLGLPSVLSA